MILHGSSRLRITFTVAIGLAVSSLFLSTASEEAQDLKTQISSKNYSTAKAAVVEAAHQRNVKLVCEALTHHSLQIRLIAVSEIQKMDDAKAVQPLLEALRANQAKYTGGSETEVLQSELNGKIVSALRQLTKLHLNERDILRAVNDVEAWTNANAATQSGTHTNQPPKND